jgi:hypothetical protein
LMLEKYFYMGQGFSGERCGPWASCFFLYQASLDWTRDLSTTK